MVTVVEDIELLLRRLDKLINELELLRTLPDERLRLSLAHRRALGRLIKLCIEVVFHLARHLLILKDPSHTQGDYMVIASKMGELGILPSLLSEYLRRLALLREKIIKHPEDIDYNDIHPFLHTYLKGIKEFRQIVAGYITTEEKREGDERESETEQA